MSTVSPRDVDIDDRVSFEVYPTAILGNQFKDVKVLARVNAQIARMFGEDIESLHANIFPTLPEGSIDDPYAYTYLRLEQLNGTLQTVAVEWIRPETFTVSGNRRLTMVFENRSPKDIERIQEALSAIGEVPTTIRKDTP